MGQKLTPTYRPPRQRFRAEDYTRAETYRQTRGDVNLSMTLIPDAYTSDEFYNLEQEKVFATSWVAVGCLSEVENPGDVIATTVASQPIVIVRTQAGELRGFYNVCRHRGAKLVEEGCTHLRKLFRCPYHNWAYDFEGTCLGTPLFTNSDIPEDQQGIFDMTDVKAFDKADYGLFSIRVATWGFLVFVNLDPDAAPLVDQLGDLPERTAQYDLASWQVVGEKVYDIYANYKLIGENYMEYYHLPWVHPELVKVSRMQDHYRWQGPGMYTGMTTWPVSRNSEDGGWDGLPPYSKLSGTNIEAGRFIWLFPNLSISLLPNHAFIMVAQPDGPNRTIETCRLLAHPESLDNPEAEAAVTRLMHFWDMVNRQDVEIVEKVQAGLSVQVYEGGRMCYRFQNMIIDRMLGIHRIPDGDAEEQVPMFV